MKIIRLTAENVKKLTAVEIKPDGHVVQITGKNGSGKSSVLDAIWWALDSAKHIQAKPIRKGETKAKIRLELGEGHAAELMVERRFTEKDSTLIVENASGARFRTPQAMLNALVGSLSFDPLAFASMDPEDQYEAVRKLVPLEVDIDALDGQNQSDFEKRTEINRQAKALRAQADGITLPPECPTARRNTAEILGRLTKVGEHNTEIERRKNARTQAAERIGSFREEAQEARDEAARLRTLAEAQDRVALAKDASADELKAKLDAAPALPEPMDAAAIRSELESAEDTNLLVDRRERKAKLIKDAEAQEAASKDLTDTMAARDEIRRKAIAEAKMPVEGLGFADGIVTFGGIPFAQASSAEQLRVSVAIAMAANPKLRVIRVQDGSLLDDDGMQMLAEMAQAGDYQIWIERVSSDGKVGIVLEDGHVKVPEREPLPLGV